MQESDLVYLIASFPDTARLGRAARRLGLPPHRITIIPNGARDAADLAESLNSALELDRDTPLDEGQRERLEWHLQNDDRPLLAVRVPAVEGRDVRRRLTESGGEMLWAAGGGSQIGDVDVDPGMGSQAPPLSHGDELAFKPSRRE